MEITAWGGVHVQFYVGFWYFNIFSIVHEGTTIKSIRGTTSETECVEEGHGRGFTLLNKHKVWLNNLYVYNVSGSIKGRPWATVCETVMANAEWIPSGRPIGSRCGTTCSTSTGNTGWFIYPNTKRMLLFCSWLGSQWPSNESLDVPFDSLI